MPSKRSNIVLNLQTKVLFPDSAVKFSYSDSIVLLGSCFSDSIGIKMQNAGFDVMVNPFGPLYNPVSVANAVSRLESAVPFSEGECVEMGAGAGLVCSFSHHTLAARKTSEAFLKDANDSLAAASSFWHKAGVVVVTLGTSFCFRHITSGETVANCLKRPASEFSREFLPYESASAVLASMVRRFPAKKFIFTVSPIRHLSDGAHMNQLSKSSLLMAVESVISMEDFKERAVYFPSFEIVMDELRDYRFYAEDMLHPSSQTVDYIWERFCDFALLPSERPALVEKEKVWRQSQHRPLSR